MGGKKRYLGFFAMFTLLKCFLLFGGFQSVVTSDLWECAVCVLCSHTSLQGGRLGSWRSPRSRGSRSSRQNGAEAGNRRPE